MLVTSKEMILKAQAGNYAVGAFNKMDVWSDGSIVGRILFGTFV